jgi:hypothetical protein
MIAAVRLLTPRLSLAAAAMAAIALPAPSAAGAQTVYMPAPPMPSPRPAWNCRAEQSVGTTKIHAARQLDAAGASLTDGAGWTDVFTADEKAPLTISVDWHPRPKPMTFAEGMATLYFRTPQPMAGPLGVRLVGRRTVEVDAHQSYDDPHHFVVYEHIGKAIDAFGGEGALKWTLRGTVPGTGNTAIASEGSYPLAELGALEAGFAGVQAQLDAMQADFANRCRRL